MRNKIYEFQWLHLIVDKDNKSVYEPTFEFFTQSQANKKGFKYCVEETKRLQIKKPPLLKDLEGLINLCQTNLKKFYKENNILEEVKQEDKKYAFSSLVEPYVHNMLDKYKMKYTNRKYLIYNKRRDEAQVLPTNDILNKDNKNASLWWEIKNEVNLVVYSKHIINKEVDEHKLTAYDKLQAFLKELNDIKSFYFTTTREQKERIIKEDPAATFPENEMVKTTLDFYDLQASLLNVKNKKRGFWYYPEKELEVKTKKVLASPNELSFMRAHGHSMCMIRYNGLYYGYYTSGYHIEQRDKEGYTGSPMDGITREQTISEIKRKQRIGQSFVSDCFPGMNNEQIQDFCMKRLEKLDSTNYMNNDEYSFDEAATFCQRYGLDDELKYIVKNFPNKEEIKLTGRAFALWGPICRYVEEGNLEMVKFFYEQGADFSGVECYLIECAIRNNQVPIVKFLFPKYKKEFRYEKIGERCIEDAVDISDCIELLDYLASNGYYCSAIEDNKKDNIKYYGQKMANAFVNHKKLHTEYKKRLAEERKTEKLAYEKKENIKKEKQAEKLILNLESSNKNIQNKIKKLSSDELYSLEKILFKK
jgi:hypothetical protein